MVDITAYPGYVSVRTPFNRRFVDDLKDYVPTIYRVFRGSDKSWLVANEFADKAAMLVARHFSYSASAVPQLIHQKIELKNLAFRLRYIGSTKEEHGKQGEAFALGMVGDNWPLIFSRIVLESWFQGRPVEERQPQKPKSYYDTLMVKPNATMDELKSGYRRMARQWHPDVCKELDAQDRFVEIQAAYNLLSDADQRRRYDIALALESEIHSEIADRRSNRLFSGADMFGFRPPLRNGIVKVKCYEFVTRVMVDSIVGWEDITDPNGRVLVASWVMGEKGPREVWV